MIEVDIQKQLQSSFGEMQLKTRFTMEEGSLLTIYGKSGAGKTSLLRILAGLLHPEEGKITVGGIPWLDTSRKINLPARKRRVGFVFQDYALFPNMTVRENIAFALPKGEDKNIIEDLIEITELGQLQYRKPALLSGGQKQRVALARAIVQRPAILLLDEPLSALDTDMRTKLQDYLISLRLKYQLTTLLVSHDIAEILKMSDQVLLMDAGSILRKGSPEEVFGQKEVSGKFQLTGEIVSKQKEDFLYVITVLIGKELVKVVSEETEGKDLRVGDKVLVASKAFNPIIHKIS